MSSATRSLQGNQRSCVANMGTRYLLKGTRGKLAHSSIFFLRGALKRKRKEGNTSMCKPRCTRAASKGCRVWINQCTHAPSMKPSLLVSVGRAPAFPLIQSLSGALAAALPGNPASLSPCVSSGPVSSVISSDPLSCPCFACCPFFFVLFQRVLVRQARDCCGWHVRPTLQHFELRRGAPAISQRKEQGAHLVAAVSPPSHNRDSFRWTAAGQRGPSRCVKAQADTPTYTAGVVLAQGNEDLPAMPSVCGAVHPPRHKSRHYFYVR